jgi:hypothetical protein
MLSEEVTRKQLAICRHLVPFNLVMSNFCVTLSPGAKIGYNISSVTASDTQWNTVTEVRQHQRCSVPAPSAGEVKLPAFWDVNGVVVHLDMAAGVTLNSESYVGTLKKIDAICRRVRPFRLHLFPTLM